MFAEYAVVRLTEDLSPTLKAGTRGVVVMLYGGDPAGYEVELFDENDRTIGVETVLESQIAAQA